MVIKIVPNDKGNPPGKLADAELHFGGESPLVGLKRLAARSLGHAPHHHATQQKRNHRHPLLQAHDLQRMQGQKEKVVESQRAEQGVWRNLSAGHERVHNQRLGER